MSFSPGKEIPLLNSRLKIIKSILDAYNGSIPFHIYLKSYFQQHKNFGSRDRKIYTAWCYAYWRLGKALPGREFNERLFTGWFLVNGPSDDLFKMLNKERLPASGTDTLQERMRHVRSLFPEFRTEDVFSYTHALSGNLTADEYATGMFTQPLVWIRILHDKKDAVIGDLVAAEMKPQPDPELELAYALPAPLKLDTLQSRIKNHFEIQDRSSQWAGTTIPALPGEHWWDCCCGAGGKSLQLFDRVPGIRITATDSRSSIIKNFRERARSYQHQLHTTVLDLQQPVSPYFFSTRFDGIIADVPCSGSGTWSRTPEQLTFFEETALNEYVIKQQAIVHSALPFLKPGGHFVYITCSVFKAENEDMVAHILTNEALRLKDSQFIDGRSRQADSMFVAIFVKS